MIHLIADVLGKAVESSLSACALMWETQMKLLAPGFGMAQPYLGSKALDGRSHLYLSV